ncbi:MAG: rRNA pseudouridine synthase [Oscillospiraceae bacterium]|nr:rRNA pseudouridine synthase [Oscillospiraceae bacterium]
MQMRLDKLLASTGRWSRREVKELVRRGCVTVNGAAARSAEEKVDADCVSVSVDGEAVSYREFTYIMLHKPSGILSATDDARQRTVLDLLPRELQRRGLFPVGRLDKDTEGLLLLTNDGALAHALLAPKKHVDKVYYAQTDGTLTQDDCDAFARGMTLADGLQCLPAELAILHSGQTSEALVTLREGKFHQVKRMLAARGNTVTYLKRLQMGPLHLDERLAAGAYRELTEEELEDLRRACR